MTTVALFGTLGLLAGLAVFQVLLICGLPLGRYGWGGGHRVLPPRLRVASVVAIGLYAGFATLLLSRAGALPGGTTTWVVAGTWVLFVYCALSVALNAVSRSRAERVVQVPVSVLLTAGVLVIAAG